MEDIRKAELFNDSFVSIFTKKAKQKLMPLPFWIALRGYANSYRHMGEGMQITNWNKFTSVGPNEINLRVLIEQLEITFTNPWMTGVIGGLKKG